MTIVEGVGWVLVHFVWQGAAIALALAALLAMTGDAQATAPLRAVVRRPDADAGRGRSPPPRA